jgi:bifunctional DNA-binding transcriptional regulator/antitoxin component of YhaV-PrlF toxin-antitoxin module
MELLTVDEEGRLIVPPELTRKLGLQPGDQVPAEEMLNGLLLRIEDAEAYAWAREWWNSLSEEEKREARKEAEWYESLSEEERDAIWNEGNEELEKWLEEDDEEDDEIDISIFAHLARQRRRAQSLRIPGPVHEQRTADTASD